MGAGHHHSCERRRTHSITNAQPNPTRGQENCVRSSCYRALALAYCPADLAHALPLGALRVDLALVAATRQRRSFCLFGESNLARLHGEPGAPPCKQAGLGTQLVTAKSLAPVLDCRSLVQRLR